MLQNLPPNTLIQELIDYLHSLAPSGTNYFSICNATLQFDQNSNGVPPSWCIAHVEFNDPAAASDIFSMSAAGNLIFRGRRLMAYADNTTQVLGRAMVSSHMPASSSLNGQNVAASIAHSPYVASGAPLHSASHQQLLMNNLPIKSAGPLPNGQDRRAYGSGPGGSGRGGRGGKRGGGRGGGGRDGRIREGRRDRPY